MKARALAALQNRIRLLMEPLYAEQAAFRRESRRQARDSARRTDTLEKAVHDLAESVLFSRWMQDPDAIFDRKEAGHWLNWLGLNGEGVEVGVFRGDFSGELLRTWRCSRLTSIDPWREFPAGDYIDTCNAPQDTHDGNYAKTCENLGTFGSRSQILRMTSADAAERFSDASLDFVYLDAQHHYEAVRADIASWHPKVRPGGVIGGHDYLDGTRPSGLYGVKRAVEEFAATGGYRLIVTREPDWPSWFVRT